MNKLITLILVCGVVFSAHAQEYYFPSTEGTDWATIPPSDLGWCDEQIDSLYNMLAENNTHAFIILKDGKIVFDSFKFEISLDELYDRVDLD